MTDELLAPILTVGVLGMLAGWCPLLNAIAGRIRRRRVSFTATLPHPQLMAEEVFSRQTAQ